MDNDAVINDLKQYITSTIGQQIQESEQRIAQLLGGKIDQLAGSVAEAIDTSNESVDDTLKNHEARLTSLEQASS